MSILNFFIAPYQTIFMQHAIIASLLIGVVCAVLSCFLILKGWSLMGDAISHSVLPGIAIAEVLGIATIIGAFISGIFTAIFTGYLTRHSKIKESTAMGIVFSGLFAIGILIISQIETDKHLMHIINGNLLGITHETFIRLIIVSVLVGLILLFKWKDLMLYCFDSRHARVVGLNISFLHYMLLSILALTIVASIEAIGVILAVALFIAPGAVGAMVSKSFGKMMITAIIVAIMGAFFGTLTSYYLDASTAACIVLVQAILVIISIIAKQIKFAHARKLYILNKTL